MLYIDKILTITDFQIENKGLYSNLTFVKDMASKEINNCITYLLVKEQILYTKIKNRNRKIKLIIFRS